MAKKKIGPDHQLAAHIPFYRTRKFWLLSLGALYILNFLFFAIFTANFDDLSSQVFQTITILLGGASVGIFIDPFLAPPINDWVSVSLFYLIFIFLMKKTLESTKISPVPPLVLSIMSIISTALITVLFSAL